MTVPMSMLLIHCMRLLKLWRPDTRIIKRNTSEVSRSVIIDKHINSASTLTLIVIILHDISNIIKRKRTKKNIKHMIVNLNMPKQRGDNDTNTNTVSAIVNLDYSNIRL